MARPNNHPPGSPEDLKHQKKRQEEQAAATDAKVKSDAKKEKK